MTSFSSISSVPEDENHLYRLKTKQTPMHFHFLIYMITLQDVVGSTPWKGVEDLHSNTFTKSVQKQI